MLARETGINGGRAGSMNVNSPADRFIGSFGIVGGSIAAATGAALALKRTTGGVAVAYFGDGAMNQGYVFECLNFAQVLKLPLVLVCENNGYGEYTPFRSVTAGEIRARAEVMGVPAETVDGMSAWTVREAAARALAHAREGEGPAFLEALTYRFVGHSRSDPGAYRPEGELDEWRGRDPIVRLRAQLEAEGFDAVRARRDRGGADERARADAGARPRRSVPCRAAGAGVQGLMPAELTMPKLSDSMAEAVIVRWLKAPGDEFTRGDGADRGGDGQGDGRLRGRGRRHARGDPRPGGRHGRDRRADRDARERRPPRRSAARRARNEPNATPVARRTAVELGVSLHGLSGTGPGGRITRDDVTKAAAGAARGDGGVCPRSKPTGRGEPTSSS